MIDEENCDDDYSLDDDELGRVFVSVSTLLCLVCACVWGACCRGMVVVETSIVPTYKQQVLSRRSSSSYGRVASWFNSCSLELFDGCYDMGW